MFHMLLLQLISNPLFLRNPLPLYNTVLHIIHSIYFTDGNYIINIDHYTSCTMSVLHTIGSSFTNNINNNTTWLQCQHNNNLHPLNNYNTILLLYILHVNRTIISNNNKHVKDCPNENTKWISITSK